MQPDLTPKRNRGAQPGNRNAYKHGYYAARLFLDDPDTLDEPTLRNMLGEIAMLKDMMYHTYRAALQTDSFDDRYKALRMMTLAANTVVQLFKLHGKRSRSGMGYIPRSLREQMTEEETAEFAEDPAPQPSPVAAFVNDDLTLDFQTAWQDLFPNGFPQPVIHAEPETIPPDEDPEPQAAKPQLDVNLNTSSPLEGGIAQHPCEARGIEEGGVVGISDQMAEHIDAVSRRPKAESGALHRTTLQRAASRHRSIRHLTQPSEGSTTALVAAILAQLASPRSTPIRTAKKNGTNPNIHAPTNPRSLRRAAPSSRSE